MPWADHVRLLRPTPMLDYRHLSMDLLVHKRGWRRLGMYYAIGAIYTFVRDEIGFGYNIADDLPASSVLAQGRGQCNNKSTLLMALLRALAVPCRWHACTVDKALHRGTVNGIAYSIAPATIVHSWVEAWFDEEWITLDGVVLDHAYLAQLQQRFADHHGPFCGYGAATSDLHRSAVHWSGGDTCIQKDAIAEDLGLFDSPDDFFAEQGASLSTTKRWLFQHVLRLSLNRNVSRIRDGGGALH